MKLFESFLSRRTNEIYCDKDGAFVKHGSKDSSLSPTSLETQPNAFQNGTTDTFPFQNLPVICKLQVFSYLRTFEKGACRFVCKEWHSLLKLPTFWKTVDLDFMATRSHHQNIEISETHSDKLKKKLLSFIGFVEPLNVKIKDLTFDLDICLGTDVIDCLFESNICSELVYITITWNNLIPASFQDLQEESSTPKQDLGFFRRRQQRHMVVFFNKFVKFVPKIERLSTPFDWSVGSTSAISMLICLKKLVLLKHSELQPLNQSTLDIILNSLINLEEFEVEVCSPSVGGLQYFAVKSPSLKHLNTCRSKGICFSSLKLPKLTHLEVSMKVYTCPLDLSISEESREKSCLYSLARNGAPALKCINDHVLNKQWQSCRYAELERVLIGTCPCLVHHKTSNNV